MLNYEVAPDISVDRTYNQWGQMIPNLTPVLLVCHFCYMYINCCLRYKFSPSQIWAQRMDLMLTVLDKLYS
jgi:hypothetical protein